MEGKFLAAIIGILVGVFLGVFIVPAVYGPRTNDDSWMGGFMMGRGGGMYSNIDRHFIEQMIPHHEGAIAMADIALQEGTHEEIKSLAAGIKEAQTLEINNMRAWYKEWFGKDVPEYSGGGMMGHGMMHMDTFSGDLDELRASDDFDSEFIRQMIPHHEMAVMMARMLLSGTDRSEMKTLADQIITSQSREIEMMRSWYKAWNN